MRLPFTIVRKYKTFLNKEEIFEIIAEVKSEKHFKGLRFDKFRSVINENSFQLQRESFGLDMVLENYPLLSCIIENENPTMVKLVIKPNYVNVGFLL